MTEYFEYMAVRKALVEDFFYGEPNLLKEILTYFLDNNKLLLAAYFGSGRDPETIFKSNPTPDDILTCLDSRHSLANSGYTAIEKGKLLNAFRSHELPPPHELFPEEPDTTSFFKSIGPAKVRYTLDEVRKSLRDIHSRQGQPEAKKITVVVPGELFGGRSAPAARDALRKEGFNDSIVAHILYKKMGENKLRVGTLLTQGDREVSDRSYRDRVDDLLEKASRFEVVVK